MKSIFIIDAEQVVTAPKLPLRGKEAQQLLVLPHTSVYIYNGRIQALGPTAKIEKDIIDDPLVIDARGKTVLPGLIDGHTHLIFAGTREEEFAMRIKGATYREIAAAGGGIWNTVEKTRKAKTGELVPTALKYLRQALHCGTTTMEIKTGYGLDLENELKLLEVISQLNERQPITLIPTFLGAHAVPPDMSLKQYTEEVLMMLPSIADKAVFCDVFCEKGYFGIDEARIILTAAKQNGLKIRMHVDQLDNNGGVHLAVEVGAASVDHLEQISEEEIRLLANSNICATLLPGVSLFLNYDYPPARKLIDQGCIVAIASNFNPGSCMCLNMQLILSLACTQMHMLPEEVIAAATANPAYSLGLDDVGLIAPGFQADLIICDVPNYKILPYFFGTNHVEKVIKKGEIVVG